MVLAVIVLGVIVGIPVTLCVCIALASVSNKIGSDK